MIKNFVVANRNILAIISVEFVEFFIKILLHLPISSGQKGSSQQKILEHNGKESNFDKLI